MGDDVWQTSFSYGVTTAEWGVSGNAVARIYCGDKLVMMVSVPTDTCDDEWWRHVAELNAQTGNLSVINDLGSGPRSTTARQTATTSLLARPSANRPSRPPWDRGVGVQGQVT